MKAQYDLCMSTAYQLLLDGEGSLALDCICRGLQVVCRQFDSRTPLEQTTLTRLLATWPALGVSVHRAGDALDVIWHKSDYSALEAAAYFRHCQQYLSAAMPAAKPPALGQKLGRKILSGVDRALQQLWTSHDGSERRRLIRYLVCSHQWLHRMVGDRLQWHSTRQQQAGRLSLYLHEPAQRCLQLMNSHALESHIVQTRRTRWRSLNELSCYRGMVEWPDGQLLKSWEQMRGDSSLLIAAFHFGDYASLPSLISAAGATDRQRLLLLYEEPAMATRRNRLLELEALGIAPARVYLNHDCDPLELVRELRRGNRSLLLYCDLPRSHGRTVAVEFMGRTARFSCATAEIALLARVPILTVITFHDGQRNQVRIPLRLPAVRRAGESRDDAVGRLTARLVKVLESYLRRYPGQWHYLPRLPGYFLPTNGLDALQI